MYPGELLAITSIHTLPPAPGPGGATAHNILMRITSGTFHTIFAARGHSGTSDGPRVSSVNPANFLSVSGDSIIVINFALNTPPAPAPAVSPR